jgi:hypothetical protein
MCNGASTCCKASNAAAAVAGLQAAGVLSDHKLKILCQPVAMPALLLLLLLLLGCRLLVCCQITSWQAAEPWLLAQG